MARKIMQALGLVLALAALALFNKYRSLPGGGDVLSLAVAGTSLFLSAFFLAFPWQDLLTPGGRMGFLWGSFLWWGVLGGIGVLFLPPPGWKFPFIVNLLGAWDSPDRLIDALLQQQYIFLWWGFTLGRFFSPVQRYGRRKWRY